MFFANTLCTTLVPTPFTAESARTIETVDAIRANHCGLQTSDLAIVEIHAEESTSKQRAMPTRPASPAFRSSPPTSRCFRSACSCTPRGNRTRNSPASLRARRYLERSSNALLFLAGRFKRLADHQLVLLLVDEIHHDHAAVLLNQAVEMDAQKRVVLTISSRTRTNVIHADFGVVFHIRVLRPLQRNATADLSGIARTQREPERKMKRCRSR